MFGMNSRTLSLLCKMRMKKRRRLLRSSERPCLQSRKQGIRNSAGGFTNLVGARSLLRSLNEVKQTMCESLCAYARRSPKDSPTPFLLIYRFELVLFVNGAGVSHTASRID